MPSAEYLEARERVANAKRQAQAMVRDIFEKEAKHLIEDMGIKSFSWAQYTPYFNDGDVCTFGVYADEPEINGYNEYGENFDLEEEDWHPPQKPPYIPWDELRSLPQEQQDEYDRKREAFRAPYRRIADFVTSYDEDDLLFMFGDHVRVVVTKDGISTEDYEHD